MARFCRGSLSRLGLEPDFIALVNADSRKGRALHEIPMDIEIARVVPARRGSPFLSTDQAAFYPGLNPYKLPAVRARGSGPSFRHQGDA